MIALLHHVPTVISMARDLIIMAAVYRWFRYLGQIRVVTMSSLLDGTVSSSIRQRQQG